MARGATLSVSMCARIVEARGGSWSPMGDTFSDPGVAEDFLRSIDPTYGPTIIRVRAEGGSKKERDALAGDWLADVEAREAGNAKLRRPVWPHIARSWADGLGTAEAWEECNNAFYLMDVALSNRVPPGPVAAAACACARGVIHLASEGKDLASDAMDRAERVIADARFGGPADPNPAWPEFKEMTRAAGRLNVSVGLFNARGDYYSAAVCMSAARAIMFIIAIVTDRNRYSPFRDAARHAVVYAARAMDDHLAMHMDVEDYVPRLFPAVLAETIHNKIPTVTFLRALRAGKDPPER